MPWVLFSNSQPLPYIRAPTHSPLRHAYSLLSYYCYRLVFICRIHSTRAFAKLIDCDPTIQPPSTTIYHSQRFQDMLSAEQTFIHTLFSWSITTAILAVLASLWVGEAQWAWEIYLSLVILAHLAHFFGSFAYLSYLLCAPQQFLFCPMIHILFLHNFGIIKAFSFTFLSHMMDEYILDMSIVQIDTLVVCLMSMTHYIWLT